MADPSTTHEPQPNTIDAPPPPRNEGHLQKRQRLQLQADAASVPIKEFTHKGRLTKLFDKHRLLEGLPAGWTMEQVNRGKVVGRQTDNYWLEPGTQRRFDSLRKVQTHLDPDGEATTLLAERAVGRLAWPGASAKWTLDLSRAERGEPRGAEDEVELVVSALVWHVENLHLFRPQQGRTSRLPPSSHDSSRRVEAVVVDGPSPFLAFAFAHRREVLEGLPELTAQELARELARKWHSQPPAARTHYAALASAQKAVTSARLASKGGDRAAKVESARNRLFALLPEDAY